MPPVRPLLAAALALFIAACSTPADLTTPPLEPQFGTSGNDSGLSASIAPGGGVYVASREVTSDRAGGDTTSLLLKRYDNGGQLLWSKLVAQSGGDACEPVLPNGLTTDARGNAHVSYTLLVGCEYDYLYIHTFSPTGSFLGRKTFYVDSYGSGVSFALDGRNNVYYTDRWSVNKAPAGGGESWSEGAPDELGDFTDVATSGDSNVYVSGSGGVGRYSGTGTLVWARSGAATEVVAAGANAVYARNLNTVRKFDASGKQLWSRTLSGLSGMVVADMAADASGNVYLTGKYGPSSNRDAFTRKLSASGATVWTRTFGTSAYDDAKGVATVTGAGIYVTGATQGALAPPYRGGENDGYVTKLNSTGTPVWTR